MVEPEPQLRYIKEKPRSEPSTVVVFYEGDAGTGPRAVRLLLGGT